MRARAYEDFAAEVVRHMGLPSPSELSVRTKVTGVRQPGEYEVDIAVKFRLCAALDFFVIIECKNWKRKVDRPVVQKLVQTRDAVAAHKAVIVSPVGFTQEAHAVAVAHGVALWVLAKGVWEKEYYRLLRVRSTFNRLRESLMDAWLVSPLPSGGPVLIGALCCSLGNLRQRVRFLLGYELTPFAFTDPSAWAGPYGPLGFIDLLDSMYLRFTECRLDEEELAGNRLYNWQRQAAAELEEFGIPESIARTAIDAVGKGDFKNFSQQVKPWLGG